MEAAIATGLSSGAAASIAKAWSTGHAGNVNQTIFDKIVQRGTVLGFPDNLRRNSYIEAPLMRHCRSTGVAHGVIYIAYVPTGKGKTTFCHNYLRSNSRKGLAFCVGNEDPPYAQQMATLLKDAKGFREEKGWLKSLFDALAKQKSFLLLDDYMNNGPNRADVTFMQQLRGVTRTSNVCVMVFTRNKESADKLANLNGMVSVLPLVNETVITELHLHLNRPMAPKEVKVDWARDLHIEWTGNDLKQVLSQDPEFADIDEQDLEARIECFLQSRQSSEARYAVNPVQLHRILQLQLTVHQDQTTPWEISSTPRTPKAPFCGCDGRECGCRIM